MLARSRLNKQLRNTFPLGLNQGTYDSNKKKPRGKPLGYKFHLCLGGGDTRSS
jgi:hypothetical protein